MFCGREAGSSSASTEAPRTSAVRRWQERINPLWRRLAGGCNVNRHAPSLIEAGGFHIEKLSTMYLPGWRLASFNSWGAAIPSESPARGEG